MVLYLVTITQCQRFNRLSGPNKVWFSIKSYSLLENCLQNQRTEVRSLATMTYVDLVNRRWLSFPYSIKAFRTGKNRCFKFTIETISIEPALTDLSFKFLFRIFGVFFGARSQIMATMIFQTLAHAHTHTHSLSHSVQLCSPFHDLSSTLSPRCPTLDFFTHIQTYLSECPFGYSSPSSEIMVCRSTCDLSSNTLNVTHICLKPFFHPEDQIQAPLHANP